MCALQLSTSHLLGMQASLQGMRTHLAEPPTLASLVPDPQGLLCHRHIGSLPIKKSCCAEVDFARRKQNAVQAYYEWIPIRPANGDTFPEILNINRTFAIGTSAAVHWHCMCLRPHCLAW